MVLPGTYHVRLTVGDRSYSTLLEVQLDPRVKIAREAPRPGQRVTWKSGLLILTGPTALAFWGIRKACAANYRNYKPGLKTIQPRKETADAAKSLSEKLPAIGGSGQPYRPPPTEPTLAALNGALSSLAVSVDSADAAPTSQAVEAF